MFEGAAELAAVVGGIALLVIGVPLWWQRPRTRVGIRLVAPEYRTTTRRLSVSVIASIVPATPGSPVHPRMACTVKVGKTAVPMVEEQQLRRHPGGLWLGQFVSSLDVVGERSSISTTVTIQADGGRARRTVTDLQFVE